MRFIKIFRVYKRISRELRLQKKFNRVFLDEELARLQTQHGGTFSPPLLKKIKNFYGLLVPTVLCSSYCHLAGKAFTEEERRRAMVITIMTPVYDDFFDEGTLSTGDIETLTFRPHLYRAKTFEEKIFRDLHLWLIENTAHPELYKSAAQNVFTAQVASEKQTDVNLPEEELYKITYDKSFYSLLLYHQILDIGATAEMKEALYPAAGLLQLSNDAFDVYKDLQDGIYTVPNRTKNAAALKKKFTEDVKRFNHLVMHLPHEKNIKEDFLITLNFICARGWVAILQLERLLNSLPVNTDMKNVERKKLICDMEKPLNVARWLLYTYRFSKLR